MSPMDGLLKQTYEDEDKEKSQEWERIKDFVGAANPVSKHPLVQEAERMKARKPEHFADGGPAGPFDVDMGDTDTFKLNGLVPRGTNAPPPTVAPPPALPPAGAQTPAVSGGVPPPPRPTPTDASFREQASRITGGVTPESIQALLDDVIQQGKNAQWGAGIAGIGDAIASVGGVQPGHMRNAEEQIEKNKELQLKTQGDKATAGKEQYALTRQLEADDPNSPFSKTSQKTYGPDLVAMGLRQDEVDKMPASMINDLFAKKVTLEEAKARIAQEGAYQKGMLENAQAQTQAAAAKALEDRGIVKRAMDMIPGTAGNKARNLLEKQAAGEPDKFDHSAIAPGTVYQAPDGSWRKKK